MQRNEINEISQISLLCLNRPILPLPLMAIYYANGMVCIRVVRYEAIAAILATCSAILAFSEYRGVQKPVGHWLSALIPHSTIQPIPVAMVVMTGSGAVIAEGGIAFATVEGFALAQFIVAILMFRGLIFKRETDELMMPGIGFMIMRKKETKTKEKAS